MTVRWKQRDIHEKREIRKLKQQHLILELAMNESLLKRMDNLITNTAQRGLSFISSTMEQLRIAVPDFQGKQFKEGEQPSEDHVSSHNQLPSCGRGRFKSPISPQASA